MERRRSDRYIGVIARILGAFLIPILIFQCVPATESKSFRAAEGQTVNEWPEWGIDLTWTIATIGAVYLAGYTLRMVFGGRLARLAARTPAHWDDQLIVEVKRRIPLWSLLVGLHLSLPRWSLAPSTDRFADQILSAIGVASATFLAASVFSRVALDYGARESVPISGLTQNLVRIAVTILGGLVIVRSFGYDITPMLTVLGVGGLTVALALQEPLSNLFAGFFVSVAGQVRIGDYVKLDGGAEGYVADLNWRSTLLRQGADHIIEVPNSKLAQSIVTNFSQPGLETAATVDVTVDHTSDLGAAERVGREVAEAVRRENPGAVAGKDVGLTFGALSEVGVVMSVTVRVKTFADRAGVRHELIKRLPQALRAVGVLLASRSLVGAPDGKRSV
jgi:small-conductance mechanosensitive channel